MACNESNSTMKDEEQILLSSISTEKPPWGVLIKFALYIILTL